MLYRKGNTGRNSMRHQRSDYSVQASCQSNQPLPSHNFLGQCIAFENQPTNTNLVSLYCACFSVYKHVLFLNQNICDAIPCSQIDMCNFRVCKGCGQRKPQTRGKCSPNVDCQDPSHPRHMFLFFCKSFKIYINMVSNFAGVAGCY